MVLWTVLIALGVVLMYTLVPVPTAAAHDAMAASSGPSTSAHAHDRPAEPTVTPDTTIEQSPCPSGHEMTHPCIGTTTSFPTMSVPTGVVEFVPALDERSDRVVMIVARAGRAPPWAVSSLDESVLLRV